MYTINKQKTASVEVHAQKTFTEKCPNELPVPGGASIAQALNQQAQCANKRIGSKEAHHPQAIWVADEKNPQFSLVEGRNVDIRWVQHAVVGSLGFELIDGLPLPYEYDYFVWQGIELDMHPYGICYHDQQDTLSTGVIEYLKIQNIKHVLVGGLATDYCVKTSALQLKRAGFSVIVNLSACKGMQRDSIEMALRELHHHGVNIVNDLNEIKAL